jgi:phosphoadenosine phosphosulfate reductase
VGTVGLGAPPNDVSGLSAAEADAVNARLESDGPDAILGWAIERFGDGLVLSTAFGVDGCALVHMASRLSAAVRVFTVDTGLLFEETIALRARLEAFTGVSVAVFSPRQSVAEQATTHGEALWTRDPDACCRLRKVEPLDRALREMGARCWVNARRRDQAPTRDDLPVVELVRRGDDRIAKVNPFVNWTRRDVWAYVLKHEVPYNPLHDTGYPSIGCVPCTAPVGEGDAERAGRWSGTDKIECGIHTYLDPVDGDPA